MVWNVMIQRSSFVRGRCKTIVRGWEGFRIGIFAKNKKQKISYLGKEHQKTEEIDLVLKTDFGSVIKRGKERKRKDETLSPIKHSHSQT